MSLITLPDFIDMEQKFARVCFEIEQNGIAFDCNTAQCLVNELTGDLNEIDKKLKFQLPQVRREKSPLKGIYKTDGCLKADAQKWIDSGNQYEIANSGMRRWVIEEPNLNNSNILRDHLLSLGWKPSDNPDRWNYLKKKNNYGKYEKVKDLVTNQHIKTTPRLKFTDDELEELKVKIPQASLIVDRLHKSHRLGVIQGFLNRYDKSTNRIAMEINPCGCNTMRVKHHSVANLPRPDKYLGKEIRGLFVASEGKVLVGCDADGLEARCMSHYFNDDNFQKLILEGDIHGDFYTNHFSDLVASRSSMKNLFYAKMYGAREYKLGTMCDAALKGHESKKRVKELGIEVNERFNKSIFGVKEVFGNLEEAYEARGSVKAIDGRLLPCRSKHSVFNTLCQAAGAIACKRWTVILHEKLKKYHLDHLAKIIIFYHDEIIVECDADISCVIGNLMVQSLKEAGEYYKFRVPLTGTYKVGSSWAGVK